MLKMGEINDTKIENRREEEEVAREEEITNGDQFNKTKEKTLILVNVYAPTSRRTDTREIGRAHV